MATTAATVTIAVKRALRNANLTTGAVSTQLTANGWRTIVNDNAGDAHVASVATALRAAFPDLQVHTRTGFVSLFKTDTSTTQEQEDTVAATPYLDTTADYLAAARAAGDGGAAARKQIIRALSPAMVRGLLDRVRRENGARDDWREGFITDRTWAALVVRGLVSSTHHTLTQLGYEISRDLFARITFPFQDNNDWSVNYIRRTSVRDNGWAVNEWETAWDEAHEMETAPYVTVCVSDSRGSTSAVADRRTRRQVTVDLVGASTARKMRLAEIWNSGRTPYRRVDEYRPLPVDPSNLDGDWEIVDRRGLRVGIHLTLTCYNAHIRAQALNSALFQREAPTVIKAVSLVEDTMTNREAPVLDKVRTRQASWRQALTEVAQMLANNTLAPVEDIDVAALRDLADQIEARQPQPLPQ